MIQKGGMLFVYKQPANPRDPQTMVAVDSPTGGNYTHSAQPMTMPPNTLNAVQLMPETRNWAFEKGAYVVGRFMTVENDPRSIDYIPPFYTHADDIGPTTTTVGIYQQPINTGINLSLVPIYCPNGNRLYPIGSSGIWGSALPPGSTSNLTVVIETEGFPKPGSENSDLVIATQPMSLDITALEIMSRAIASLPPGVPVGENGIGEWFFKIVDGIGRALSFIPHPFAQAGALAAKGIVMMRPTPKAKTMRIAANKPKPPPMPVRLQNRPMAINRNPPKPPPGRMRHTEQKQRRQKLSKEDAEWDARMKRIERSRR